MVGNVWGAGSKKTPGVWKPCAGEADCVNGWHLRTFPATPPGGWAQDVNASGQAVGMEGTSCCRAMYWDADGTMQVLPPRVSGGGAAAWSINDAGTVIVGQSDGTVVWVRASTTVPFGQPIALPSKTSGCSVFGAPGYAVMPDLVT